MTFEIEFAVVHPKFLKDNPKQPKHRAGQKIAKNFKAKSLKHFEQILCKHGIVISQLENGIRRTDDLKECQMLAWDFDDFRNTSKSVHEMLSSKNIEHYIFGSYSWTKDCDKFHLFIPCKTPIRDYKLYKHIAKNMALNYKWKIDQSTTDSVRFFARHTKLLYHGGKRRINLNDWEKHLKKHNTALDKLKQFRKHHTELSDTAKERLTAEAEITCEKPSGKFSDGDVYTIIGKCMMLGMSIKEIEQFFSNHTLVHTQRSHPLNDKDLPRLISWCFDNWE